MLTIKKDIVKYSYNLIYDRTFEVYKFKYKVGTIIYSECYDYTEIILEHLMTHPTIPSITILFQSSVVSVRAHATQLTTQEHN